MLIPLILLFITFSAIAVICSTIAFTVSNILVYENILNWYGRWLGTLPEWLGKPLGLCSKCFAGQLALWSSLFIVFYAGQFAALCLVPYSVCLSIYLTTKY